MTDLERYILDEGTDDCRSGRFVRREFLRRIAVLSGSAAAGLAVLASRGVRASVDEIAQATGGPVAALAQASGTTVAPNDPAIEARAVSFPLGGTTILAYLALPRNKPNAPGVSVVHENRGLLEHHKDVTRRLAKAGYAALAVDLVSPGGGTNVTDDSAQVTALLVRTPPDDLVGMLQAGVRYLQGLPSVRADRQGAVGFCFGGGMVWRLATRTPHLRAAVPVYGPNPPIQDVPKNRPAGAAPVAHPVPAPPGAVCTAGSRRDPRPPARLRPVLPVPGRGRSAGQRRIDLCGVQRRERLLRLDPVRRAGGDPYRGGERPAAADGDRGRGARWDHPHSLRRLPPGHGRVRPADRDHRGSPGRAGRGVAPGPAPDPVHARIGADPSCRSIRPRRSFSTNGRSGNPTG